MHNIKFAFPAGVDSSMSVFTDSGVFFFTLKKNYVSMCYCILCENEKLNALGLHEHAT